MVTVSPATKPTLVSPAFAAMSIASWVMVTGAERSVRCSQATSRVMTFVMEAGFIFSSWFRPATTLPVERSTRAAYRDWTPMVSSTAKVTGSEMWREAAWAGSALPAARNRETSWESSR